MGHLIISIGQRVKLVANVVVGCHSGSVHLIESFWGSSGVHILGICCDIAICTDQIGKRGPIRTGEVG